MFDYHMHTKVSFDSKEEPINAIAAAEARGLREICFTDHYDYNDIPTLKHDLFTLEDYSAAYDSVSSETLLVRRGVEFGLTPWNRAELAALTSARRFDFVIGSVHCVDGHDPYEAVYWEGRSVASSFRRYLEQVLECVLAHDGFDVLGHLNYVCKSPNNPTHEPLRYEDYREICDEIMRVLVRCGKGIEINASGVDRVGSPLPSRAFVERFRELGGEIVTVGSDAHVADRVGYNVDKSIEIARDVFGYVCTFAERKPIFHKLKP